MEGEGTGPEVEAVERPVAEDATDEDSTFELASLESAVLEAANSDTLTPLDMDMRLEVASDVAEGARLRQKVSDDCGGATKSNVAVGETC